MHGTPNGATTAPIKQVTMRFSLTAGVTVIDAAGVAVKAPSFAQALRIIRSRPQHKEPPTVSLAATTARSTHIENGRWVVRPDSVDAAAASDQPADYTLRYNTFVLTRYPSDDEYTSSDVDKLLQAVAGMSHQSHQAIDVETDLLGLVATTFLPLPPKPTRAPAILAPRIPPRPTQPPSVGSRRSVKAYTDNALRALTKRLRRGQ